jgi:hypothetical protein
MDLLDFGLNDNDHISKLRASYQSAEPFPHVVLHDVVIPTADSVVSTYPGLDWKGWDHARQHSYSPEKRTCRNIERIPDLLRQLIYELESPAVLRFLSTVTGIEKLIPDPYLEGGGLHCTASGGQLVPHTDFHLYDRLNLYRQLNLLLYLNPTWVPGHGGELELFHKGEDSPVVSIAPTFGTCVIFRTDDQSVHGVNPITEAAEPRKSIALYYYTSTENQAFSGDDITYWQVHDVTGLSQAERVELRFAKAATRMARLFYRLAHRTNPIYREGAPRGRKKGNR